jgi:hypothetical protein
LATSAFASPVVAAWTIARAASSRGSTRIRRAAARISPTRRWSWNSVAVAAGWTIETTTLIGHRDVRRHGVRVAEPRRERRGTVELRRYVPTGGLFTVTPSEQGRRAVVPERKIS